MKDVDDPRPIVEVSKSSRCVVWSVVSMVDVGGGSGVVVDDDDETDTRPCSTMMNRSKDIRRMNQLPPWLGTFGILGDTRIYKGGGK